MRGKLWVWAALLLLVAEVLPFVSIAATTKAVDKSIWDEPIIITADQNIDENDRYRSFCEYQNLSRVMYKPSGVTGTGGNLRFDPLSTLAPVTKEECVVQNKYGVFGGALWSPTGNPADALEINGALITAVPASNVVLFSSSYGSDPYGSFRTSINYNLPAIGRLDAGSSGTGSNKKMYKKWTVTSRALDLRYSNGSPMLFRRWEFSRNGKYAIGALTTGMLIRLNLETQELQPVAQMSASTNWALAISNDGNYVLSRGANTSALNFHDLSGCQNKYSEGNYPATGMSVAGCTTRSILNLITSKYPDSTTASIFNFQFALNSASVNVDAHWGINNRRRITFSPENYTPVEQGYLAMGDSYSSGEGDNKGGDWYEPGTDEQGDINTFAGRNLCHLSRRSYPYLMAVELGYLSNNLDSPPADGDFHSVACSGAVMHNVVGGAINGIVGYNAGEDIFKDADGQYRYDFRGSLDNWQPGRVRQLDFFEPTLAGYSQTGQKPEVITIGIGGNDAGFGDIVSACAAPGTCPQAEPQSLAAANQALTIANLKPRLVDTYKRIKLEAPDVRIYVHGYPNFVQDGGECANNVRLDAKEITMVSEGIQYLNRVVKAAAQEAGVVYVDIETVLDGADLCSKASDADLVFNGVTAGNDFSVLPVDILSAGVCVLRNGCLGKESFHPNSTGHKLYAERIMQETNNLTAVMPTAQTADYPLPYLQYYGQAVWDKINYMNLKTATIPFSKPEYGAFLTQTASGLSVGQGGFMVGSQVTIQVHSTPQTVAVAVAALDGTVNIDIDLPQDLEPGVHEIHLLGYNSFGDPVEYFQTVLVGASETDFDGDGVINEDDSCPTVTNSFVDSDEDGVDDACDLTPRIAEQVSETPPDEAPPEEPQDTEPADYIDKGVPSPETVAGNEQTLGASSVLGTSTIVTATQLSATGIATVSITIVGIFVVIVALLTKRRAQVKYRIGRR